MAYKVTLLFQDSTGIDPGNPGLLKHIGGWTESYYISGITLADVKDRLYNPGAWGQGLCPARAALLPATGAIVGQRFSVVLPPSGSSQTASRQFPGTSTFETDVPQMALQVAAPANGAVNIRRFSLRGIPDSQVTFGEYTPGFFFDAAVKAFFAELFQWGFVGQNFTILPVDILSIDTNGLVTTAAAHGLVTGDLVQVKKTKEDFPEQFLSFKRKVVSAPTATTFLLLNWTGHISTGGTARKILYVLYQFDTVNIAANRIGVRKVGRPFGGYRGRRSKRTVL